MSYLEGKIIKEIRCGFNKWSLGINEYGSLNIKFGHDPIYGEMQLSDLSVSECKALSKMFADWATVCEAKAELEKKV